MATSTFDRELKLSPEGVEKFFEIMEKPGRPLSDFRFDDAYWKRSEELLNKCLLNSKL